MTPQTIDLLPLKKYLHTTVDGHDMQIMLHTFSEKLFQTTDNTQDIFTKELPYDVASFLTKLLEQYQVNKDDKMQIRVFLTEVIKTVNDLPVVALTLAKAPKRATIMTIQEWFLRTYNKLIILDISIDPDLIAGSVIQFQGKYHDYSLKKQLDTKEAVEKV
jgi:F0F1-type ATP synthase delta subunit